MQIYYKWSLPCSIFPVLPPLCPLVILCVHLQSTAHKTFETLHGKAGTSCHFPEFSTKRDGKNNLYQTPKYFSMKVKSIKKLLNKCTWRSKGIFVFDKYTTHEEAKEYLYLMICFTSNLEYCTLIICSICMDSSFTFIQHIFY